MDRDGRNIGCLFSFDICDERRYTRPVWDGQLVLESLRGSRRLGIYRHLKGTYRHISEANREAKGESEDRLEQKDE